MSVAWKLNAWGTNSWVGMNGGPPNAWRGGGTVAPVVVVTGGSGSEDDDGSYSEPRRVLINGKPYTVRSKAEYLGLLARGKRDRARQDADAVIGRSQDVAREALFARKATEETATLLHALLAREEKNRPKVSDAPFETDAIPLQILMMMAADL